MPQSNAMPRVPSPVKNFPAVIDVLGVHFHSLTIGETLDLFDRFITERVPRQITFANAQTVALCRQNATIAKVINESDLTLADGMSIVWGARMLGIRFPERVGGPDVMHALCGRAATKAYRVFLMGSSPENLERLQAALVKSWPGLNVVGTHSPPMCDRIDEKETAIIIKQLRATNPDILFVGVSCPKQELWIHENKMALDVPVCLAVGAAFDFLSGRIPRAPEWLRKRGFEWLYRLYCEPRRLWKRYLLGNTVFLSLLIRRRLRLRFFS